MDAIFCRRLRGQGKDINREVERKRVKCKHAEPQEDTGLSLACPGKNGADFQRLDVDVLHESGA